MSRWNSRLVLLLVNGSFLRLYKLCRLTKNLNKGYDTSLMYEIKILLNRCLTTPLFCISALRSCLECEIGTAVEPFREKNNNVKPVIESVREGIICLLFFLLLNIYLLLQFSGSMKCFQCLLAQRSVSSALGSFILLNVAPYLARDWMVEKR